MTVSGEIGQEWEARRADGKPTDDLRALVEEIVPFNMKNNGEPDACDLLMEVGIASCFPRTHASHCVFSLAAFVSILLSLNSFICTLSTHTG